MKIRMLLSAVVPALVSVFVAGCFCTTPTEVTKAYLDAAGAMDFDKVASLSGGKMSEDAKKGAEELAHLKESERKGDKTAREKMALVAKIEGIFENISYKVEGEKIDGDLAVVDVLADLEGKTTATIHIYLKKIDGKWKVVNKADHDQAAPQKSECKKSGCKKKAECEKAGCKKSECKKDECRKSGCKKPECGKAECEKAGCRKSECQKDGGKKADCKKEGCKKAEPAK